MIAAAAGKFGIDLLIGAALQMTRDEPDGELRSWGLAYCYGNRLEAAKVGLGAGQKPDLERLADVRTDMAVLALGLSNEQETPVLQPLLRKEKKQTWAFCSGAGLPRPEGLDTGRLRPQGDSVQELLFLHLLSRLKSEDPVGSVRTTLEAMDVEAGLVFLLLGAEVLVAARWIGTAQPEEKSEMWLGQGPLLRIVAPTPLRELERVEWGKLGNRSVMAITRLRRPIG
ncbi:MAG: hypothetical protein JSU73_10975 [candidate division WOR-3 bacterium]|nr:MAG: hypothetical protein JSU73_10975 [candidate division WOR-3 bacterium]